MDYTPSSYNEQAFMNEKTLSQKTIYRGKILDLVLKKVLLPNGHIASREIIVHEGVIAVIPILEDGRIIMVKQYRKPAELTTIEIPAGRIDPGETPQAAVHRELKEETGFVSKKIKKLMSFYPAIGYCSEKIHLFTARGLTLQKPDPDDDECIEVIKISLKRALKMIDQGKIIDSKSILGLLYLAYRYIPLE